MNEMTKTIEMLNSAAPAVWAAAQRQVSVDLIWSVALGTLALAASVFLLRKAVFILRDTYSNNAEIGVLCGILGGVAALMVLMCSWTLFDVIGNPQWAAIRNIAALAK